MSVRPPEPDCSPDAMRSLYSPMITLRVGQEQRDFVVHFDRLLRLIKVFVGWIYKGPLFYATDDPQGNVMDAFDDDRSLSVVKNERGQEVVNFGSEFAEESPQTWYWHTLTRMFLFSDWFEVPTFCACVLNTMCKKYLSFEHGVPSVENINHAFENTTERSPLKAFIMATFASAKPDDNSMQFWMALPKELLAAQMKASASESSEEPYPGCFKDSLDETLIKGSAYCSGLSYYKGLRPEKDDLCILHQIIWGHGL